MLTAKTKAEIQASLEKRLKRDTQVTDLDPGTIARALCDIFSEELGDLYKELRLTTTMNFVSTAKGGFLDMIGGLLNCTRFLNESDSNYRSRIVNQVYVIAGANETSIRLRILSIASVKNVLIREFARGTGSFSVYVITDDLEPVQSVLDQVETVVKESKAAGIYVEVHTPVLIPTEVKVRLVFSSGISDAEKASIRQITRQNIKSYIDNISPGGSFIVNELVRAGMDSSKNVVDVDVYDLRINSMPQFVRNFQTNWNERIAISKLEII